MGDVRHMVGAHNTPFIYAPGDEESFIGKLEALCYQKNMRLQVGEANRQRCEQEFGLDGMIDAYRQMYEEGVHGSAAAPTPAGATHA